MMHDAYFNDPDYEDDGPGFCYAAIPEITLNRTECGLLDIALDTSVLINYLQFGRYMLDDRLDEASGDVDEDVRALGNLLDLWMCRAIRFHLSPLNIQDAKKRPDARRIEERERALYGLASAITCHNNV